MKKWILYIVLSTVAGSAFAQEYMQPSKGSGYVNLGVSYQQWTAEDQDTSLNQTAAPLLCFYPVNANWFLTATNTPATASWGDSSVSGLSDTWLRVTYVSADERWMINMGVGAPTGKTELTAAEYMITRQLSENILRFRLPNYGQGLSAKVGAGMTFPMQGGTVLGLGANYILKQPYSLWSGLDSEYDPGDEINIVGGVSMPVQDKGKWSLDLVYTMYTEDLYNDEKMLEAGDKILISSTLAYRLNPGFLYASLRYRQRGKNDLYLPGNAQDDSEKISKKTIGDQIETDGLWEFTQWPEGGLSLLWDGRFYSENEDGFGKASVYGAGLGIQHKLSPTVLSRIQLKYLTGTIESVVDIDISGFDILASLKITI
ncbi:hypothetical protein JW948_13410 [bacterium]|nr:hypothetical protein [bacterium]